MQVEGTWEGPAFVDLRQAADDLGVTSKWMLGSSKPLTFLAQPQFSTPAG